MMGKRVEGRDEAVETNGREQTLVSFRGYFKHIADI